VNPLYAILEHRYSWLILAGLSFTAGCVGAMMMLAFTWSHDLARAWLYLSFVLTIYFGLRAFLHWKSQAEASLKSETDSPRRRGTTGP
jgi:hypothetical protein